MSWQLASLAVILASPILIGGYDLVAFWMAGSRATISRVSLETALTYPAYKWSVCFLFGLLCGHLFAPSDGPRQLPSWLSLVFFLGVPVVVAFGSLVLGVGREPESARQSGASYPLAGVLVWLALGAAVGASYLPQARD